MKIVLCYPVEGRHIDQIRAAAPDAHVVDAGQERVAAELPDCDLFCGHPKVPVPWDDVVQRGRLTWIQSSAAGLDHCLVPSVVASPITVTSASGVLADQVAEHGIGLLKVDELAHYRSQVEIDTMRTIKRALDPLNLMNPGKIVRV